MAKQQQNKSMKKEQGKESAVSPNKQTVMRSSGLEQPIDDVDRLSAEDVTDLQQTYGNRFLQRLAGNGDGGGSEGDGGGDGDKVETAAGPDIQRAPKDDVAGAALTDGMENQIDRKRSGGRPLPENVQGQMEDQFQADFSDVRVHDDAESDKLNRSLNAKAFTTGSDIFFADGNYAPNAEGGQKLLAHELTHVVQQGGGKPVQKKPKDEKSPEETAADTRPEQQAATAEQNAPDTEPKRKNDAEAKEPDPEKIVKEAAQPPDSSKPETEKAKQQSEEAESKAKEPKTKKEKEQRERKKKEKKREAQEAAKGEQDKKQEEAGKKSNEAKNKEKDKKKKKEEGKEKEDEKKKEGKKKQKKEKKKPGGGKEVIGAADLDGETAKEKRYDREAAEFEEPDETPLLPTWDQLAEGTVQLSLEDVEREYRIRQGLSADEETGFSAIGEEDEVTVEEGEGGTEPEKSGFEMANEALAEGAVEGLKEGATSFIADQAIQAATAKVPYADGLISLVQLGSDPKGWVQDNVLVIGDNAKKAFEGFKAIGEEETAWGYIAATLEAVISVVDLISSIVGLINTIFTIVLFVAKMIQIFSNFMISLAPVGAPFFPFAWTPGVFTPISTFMGFIIGFLHPVNDVLSLIGNILINLKFGLQPLAILFRYLDMVTFKGDPEKLEDKQEKLKGNVKGFTQTATTKTANNMKDNAIAGTKNRIAKSRAKKEIADLQKERAQRGDDPELDAKIEGRKEKFKEQFGEDYETFKNRPAWKEAGVMAKGVAKGGGKALKKTFGDTVQYGMWQKTPGGKRRSIKDKFKETYYKSRAEINEEMARDTAKYKKMSEWHRKRQEGDAFDEYHAGRRDAEAQQAFDKQQSKYSDRQESAEQKLKEVDSDQYGKTTREKEAERQQRERQRDQDIRDVSDDIAQQRDGARRKRQEADDDDMTAAERDRAARTAQTEANTRDMEARDAYRTARTKRTEAEAAKSQAVEKRRQATNEEDRAKQSRRESADLDRQASQKRQEADDLALEANRLRQKANKTESKEERQALTREAIQKSRDAANLREDAGSLERQASTKRAEANEAVERARTRKEEALELEREVQQKRIEAREEIRGGRRKAAEAREAGERARGHRREAADARNNAQRKRDRADLEERLADNREQGGRLHQRRKEKYKEEDWDWEKTKTTKAVRWLTTVEPTGGQRHGPGALGKQLIKGLIQSSQERREYERERELANQAMAHLAAVSKSPGDEDYDPDGYKKAYEKAGSLNAEKWHEKIKDRVVLYSDALQAYKGLRDDIRSIQLQLREAMIAGTGADATRYPIKVAIHTILPNLPSDAKHKPSGETFVLKITGNYFEAGSTPHWTTGGIDTGGGPAWIAGDAWKDWADELPAELVTNPMTEFPVNDKVEKTYYSFLPPEQMPARLTVTPEDVDLSYATTPGGKKEDNRYRPKYQKVERDENTGDYDVWIGYEPAAADNPPKFTSQSPPTKVTAGETYDYTVTATDEDESQGDSLTLNAPQKPDWLTLTDMGDGAARLTGTPTEGHVGAHDVSVVVEDEAGQMTAQAFSITVESAATGEETTAVQTKRDDSAAEGVMVQRQPEEDEEEPVAPPAAEEAAMVGFPGAEPLAPGAEVPVTAAEPGPEAAPPEPAAAPPEETAAMAPPEEEVAMPGGGPEIAPEPTLEPEAAPMPEEAATAEPEVEEEEEEETAVGGPDYAQLMGMARQAQMLDKLPPPPENMIENVQGPALAYADVEVEEYDLRLQHQQIGQMEEHAHGQRVELEGAQKLTKVNKMGVEKQQQDAETKMATQEDMKGKMAEKEGGAKKTSEEGDQGENFFSQVLSKIIEGFGLGGAIGAGGDADAAGAEKQTKETSQTTTAAADMTKDGQKMMDQQQARTQKVHAEAGKIHGELDETDDMLGEKREGNEEGIEQLAEARTVNQEQLEGVQTEKERLHDEHMMATEEAEIWAEEHRTVREEIFGLLEEDLSVSPEEQEGRVDSVSL